MGSPLYCQLSYSLFLFPVFPTLHRLNNRTELDIHRIEKFPWNICNGCGMPAGSAYPSGHLIPSPILGLASPYAPIVEIRFLELAMSLFDFSSWIPFGTFSILHGSSRLPTELPTVSIYVISWQPNLHDKIPKGSPRTAHSVAHMQPKDSEVGSPPPLYVRMGKLSFSHNKCIPYQTFLE